MPSPEHGKLRKLEHPRPAGRSRGPDPDDPWVTAPEGKPGSSNSRQHQLLGFLYRQLGITERETRLTDMTDRLGRAITSAKDLSYVEAETAIRELRKLAAEEKGGS